LWKIGDVAGNGVTIIVPVLVTVPQPPVKVTVNVNGLPVTVVGVPVIVTTLFNQVPLTPVGKPVNNAPFANVVT